ncbi:MAG: SPOR domain-containing protein [Micavibrio sp.]
MINKDEFDDNAGFQSAFGKIADAMEQSRSGMRQRGPLLGLLTAAVAFFVLFAVFWSTYPRGDKDSAGNGPVPMIRADVTPFKSTPDDPGGMDIPYRDSTVFETLRSAKNDSEDGPRIESLLPAPEEPMPRDQMFAGLKTDTLETPPDAIADPALDAGPVQSDSGAAQAGAILVEKPADVATAAPVPVVKPAPPAEVEPAAGNAKDRNDADGTHYVQLGSVKDRAGAEAEWAKLKKQFPAELGDLSLRIQDVTLPERGTFYRIQGGTLAQAKAKEVCTAIAAKRSGGCLVVAR